MKNNKVIPMFKIVGDVKQYKSSGFTLIELLAVIIILAIVALIATPIILDVIDDSRDSANLSEVNLILGGAETFFAQSFLTGDFKQFDGVTNLYSNIKTTHEKPPLGNLTIRSDGKTSLSIYNEGVCYTKSYDDSEVQVDKTITSLDDCVPLSIVVYTDKKDTNNWYNENLSVTIETNGERFEYCLKDETDVCTNVEVTETATTVDLTTGFNEICATGYRGENTSDTCVEFNIDTVVPTLIAKSENIIGLGENHNISSFYEEPLYGISGGYVSCNPTNTSNLTTTTTVTCKATSNAGLSSGNVETEIVVLTPPSEDEYLYQCKYYHFWKDEATPESHFTFNEELRSITHYLQNDSEVIIPCEYNGVPVEQIGVGEAIHMPNYAFVGKNVTSVIIPDSVTTIGGSSFRVSQIVNIKIPDSVTSLGEGAFYNVTTLRNIDLGRGISVLKTSTLYNTQLETLVIPSNIKTIEKQEIMDFDTLIIEEGGVTYLPADFRTTSPIKKASKFVIPSTLTGIHPSAFGYSTQHSVKLSVDEVVFTGTNGVIRTDLGTAWLTPNYPTVFSAE